MLYLSDPLVSTHAEWLCDLGKDLSLDGDFLVYIKGDNNSTCFVNLFCRFHRVNLCQVLKSAHLIFTQEKLDDYHCPKSFSFPSSDFCLKIHLEFVCI